MRQDRPARVAVADGSETAWFADYILLMGLGTERHDMMN